MDQNTERSLQPFERLCLTTFLVTPNSPNTWPFFSTTFQFHRDPSVVCSRDKLFYWIRKVWPIPCSLLCYFHYLTLLSPQFSSLQSDYNFSVKLFLVFYVFFKFLKVSSSRTFIPSELLTSFKLQFNDSLTSTHLYLHLRQLKFRPNIYLPFIVNSWFIWWTRRRHLKFKTICLNHLYQTKPTTHEPSPFLT